MRKKEKAKKIQKILNRLYPDPQIPLDHKDAYTLLIATLLSAQSTDLRVNLTTPILFKKAHTPQEMVQLGQKEIEKIIKPIGLSPKKSKAIWELSKILIEKHRGKVPATFEELEELPGVGHKTASCVLAHYFKLPAFPVDTHIHRLAKRWGLSKGKNVEQTEKDLKKLFVQKDWIKVHLQMIFFGREYCKARGHDPENCPICSIINI